ncbi:hypothetical protein BU14_0626s0004 [Porphyra umbilicalis]|uniref:PDZ domain-containing protein n=1 Tax=Porphyra umbilicalis TaxID=2786 RepID=A0A1X6NR20_PORUM|nr:hypothetical protein BU14_0626s0004 [Porphyra umbilicalis]|eukprot:OSX70936.1 hypothetical protein BU14_0626s0004 [Porphyra umbilicalis]
MATPSAFLPLSPLAVPSDRRAVAARSGAGAGVWAPSAPRRAALSATAGGGGGREPRRSDAALAAAMALLVGLVLPSPVRRGGPAVGPSGGVAAATKEGAEAAGGPGGVPVVMVKGTQRKGFFEKLQPGSAGFSPTQEDEVTTGVLVPGKTGIPGAVAPAERLPKARTSASFVTAAVQTVGPAVVRIDTEHTVEANEGLLPLLEDPMFKKFFEHELRKGAREPPVLQRGQGSGFIVSAEGLLITNAHVVKGAHKVTVTLTDGRSYTATVKGTDDLLDLAVLKIENKGKNLPVAPLGVSSELQVGDWVIAVGNPVGLDNTVTLGIVSSLNRSSAEIGIPEKRLNFIQTDAAINVRASGGPLVNEFGEVVGINTAIRANAEGIGFAIPIDRAASISAALAAGQKIQHAYVGIQMTTLTPEFAKLNNEDPNSPSVIPEVDGAVVVRVVPKSPAATAGIRRFDVIQSIDGSSVKSAKDVLAYVESTKVGQVVDVTVLRGGDKAMKIAIKTGDLAAVTPAGDNRPSPFPGGGGGGGGRRERLLIPIPLPNGGGDGDGP